MTDIYWVHENPQIMVLGEEIAWIFDFANVGTADPTAAGDTLAYNSAGRDVSATMLSGAPSLAGSRITAKKFAPTSAGSYTVTQPATIDGNTVYLACKFEVVKLGG